jgi:hypothetical protein
MSIWIGIVIFLVILIVIIWYVHHMHKHGKLPDGVFKDTYENIMSNTTYKYDEYFTDPKDLYNKTVGYELDDNAKLAINKAEKKDDMYSTNEKIGKMSRSKKPDAVENSFILANLYSYNLAPNQKGLNNKLQAKKKAADMFTKTLNRITEDPIITREQPVEFMIDRAEDFYEDFIIQARNAPEIVREVYIPDFGNIRDLVRNNIPKDQKFTPRKITSDPQNVHDSQVINDMKEIYFNIRERNKQDYRTNEEIMNDLKVNLENFPYTNSKQKSNVKKIVDIMKNNKVELYLGGSENELLTDVWKRITSQDNKSNRQSLKESLVDALDSSIESGKPVCTMGRCSRVLSSLTLLDNDEAISKSVKTKDLLRNEILSKSYVTLQKVLDSSPAEITAAYSNPEVLELATPEVKKGVDDLENKIKSEIETTIRNDYKDVKNETLDDLIKDALHGV